MPFRDSGLTRTDRTIALAIMSVTTITFYLLINATIPRNPGNAEIFGADAQYYFRAFTEQRYYGLGYHKHPGAVLWAMLTAGPLRLLHVPANVAAGISLGLGMGIGTGALFLVMRLLGLAIWPAIAIVALGSFRYVSITIGSVVETYGLTTSAVSVTLLLSLLLAKADMPNRWKLPLGGLAVFVSGFFNVPVAAYALMVGAFRLDRGGDRSTSGAALAIVIAVIVAIPLSLLPMAVLDWSRGYQFEQGTLQKWSSFSHFSNPEIIKDAFSTVLAFSQVSAADTLSCRYLWSDLALYVASPLRGLAVLGWLALFATGTVIACAHRVWRWTVAAAYAVIVTMVAFYVFFAPSAMALFAIQWTPALLLIIAPLLWKWPRAWPIVAVFAVFNAVLNGPVLLDSQIGNYDMMCPASKQGVYPVGG